jgi:hypothetical protein
VRYKVEIYNYERKIDRVLEKINKSCTDQKNKTAILDFYNELLCRGLSKARILKYLNTLESVDRFFGKTFVNATKNNIVTKCDDFRDFKWCRGPDLNRRQPGLQLHPQMIPY